MFEVYCEWDIGQEDLIFKTDTDAWNWIGANLTLMELAKEVNKDIKEYISEIVDEGLVGVKEKYIA